MAKRLLAISLMAVMAFSILGGCGQTTATTTAATAAEVTQAAPAATAADATAAATGTAATEPAAFTLPIVKDKVELSLWWGFNPRVEQYMKDMNENYTFKEMEKRTNVHINFLQVNAPQQMEKFNLAAAAGEWCDMYLGMGQLYAGGADKAVSDGVLVNLKDKLAEFAPNYNKILNESDDNRKNVTTDAGNITDFGSGMTNSAGPDFGPQVRGDWLEELGISNVETYDDYYNMLKAFKEKKGATGAYLMDSNAAPRAANLTSGFGIAALCATSPFIEAPFYQVDGKVKFGLIETGFQEYITMLNKWYSEGLIYKDYISNNQWAPLEAPILNGESGLWYTDQTQISTYAKKASDPKFKVVAIQDAVKNKGDKTHFSKDQGTSMGGGISITTSCKNLEVAMKWCDYWYTQDGYILANYGLEGQTFNYVDGKPQFTELITKNPEGMDAQLAVYRYVMEQGGFIVDKSRTNSGFTADELAAPKIWATNKDYSYQIPMAATLNAEEAGEYSAIIADILTYSNENVHKFIMGKKPMSEFPAYVQKLKDMGIEKCIALKQASLDRYNAR